MASSAYQLGFQDGQANARNDRVRKYQSEKAERTYWERYKEGMIQANPGKGIVQCGREGKIFAVDNVMDCKCPVCGRRYINKNSDRPLKVLQPVPGKGPLAELQAMTIYGDAEEDHELFALGNSIVSDVSATMEDRMAALKVVYAAMGIDDVVMTEQEVLDYCKEPK